MTELRDEALTLGPAYEWAVPAGTYDLLLTDGTVRWAHVCRGGETQVDGIEIRYYREPMYERHV